MSRPDRLSTLLVDLSLRFGGADVRVMQLARLLSSEFSVRVVVLQGSETEERFRAAGLSTIAIATRRKDPRTVLQLARIFRNERADIIDLHNAQSQLWGLLAGTITRVPVRIATIHSIYEQSEKRGRRLGIYRRLIALVGRLATDVISVSEAIDDHLKDQRIRLARRAVIHNGIDDGTLPKKWSVPLAGTRRIACVGRLVPVKGHSFLFKALGRSNATAGEEWECLVVGDGPEASELRGLARSLAVEKQVRFLGYRSDATEIMSTADILCMPSLSEGLPFTLLEAALLERPIIASAVGGIGQHFRHLETAYLVKPGDVNAVESALLWAVTSPDEARQMGRRARQMVLKQFSSARMVRETEAFYRSAFEVGKPIGRLSSRAPIAIPEGIAGAPEKSRQ